MAYRRHYSKNHFTNQGELWIDQDLYTQLNAHPDYWVGLHSLLLNQGDSSSRGECDFVLFHKLGIIVLEVKASEIKYENGSFWQKEKGEFKERSNFFTQAERNAQKIIDLLNKRGIFDVLVTSTCVFPESIIEYRSDVTRPFWSIASKNAGRGLSDFIEDELVERRGFYQNAVNLDRSRIDSLVTLLSPDLLPNDILQHLTISAQQAKVRGEQNLAMLDGLNANPRIMIAGPAGSGKSSFGKLQLARKFKEGKKKLLYICWNEFLAKQIKLDLIAEKIEADVWPLYQLWVYLAEKMNTVGPVNFNWSSDTSVRNEEIKSLIFELEHTPEPLYDFIVADEAQDLFNRGLMDLVPALLHNKSTLKAGEFTILYDNSQAFGSTSTKDDYQLNLEAFRESSAIYQLSERFRGHDGTGIFEFIRELDRGTPDFAKPFGEDVKIEKWNSDEPNALARKLITLKNHYNTIVKLPLSEILLLFTSNLASGDINRPKAFDPLIEKDFTPLSKDNIGNTDKTVKYATCLKCKGLEKSVVILVVEKSDNLPLIYHQIFIGATRAKSKIHVYLPE
jgi:hypothetical protein